MGKFLSENPLTYARSSEILGNGFLNLTLSAWLQMANLLCPRDDTLTMSWVERERMERDQEMTNKHRPMWPDSACAMCG